MNGNVFVKHYTLGEINKEEVFDDVARWVASVI